mmetsp:Transcript_32316/g.83855  ORF Transcript_32316/g.83855 Transcript_32316/m.83855 type:complete len:87 (-) Transcript_32316:241-501(-)
MAGDLERRFERFAGRRGGRAVQAPAPAPAPVQSAPFGVDKTNTARHEPARKAVRNASSCPWATDDDTNRTSVKVHAPPGGKSSIFF